jgi:hypothetical protein
VSLRGRALLFFPLVAAGAGSVIYWLVRDDFRFYFLIQTLAVLAIPLMVALFPPRYTGGRELLLAVALYGLAKAFELLDEPIYRLGHLVSGHTLKHIFAGLAGWAYLRTLRPSKRKRGTGISPVPRLVAAGSGSASRCLLRRPHLGLRRPHLRVRRSHHLRMDRVDRRLQCSPSRPRPCTRRP